MSLTLIEPRIETPVKRQPPAFPRPINPYRPPEPHAIVEKIEPGSLAEEMGIVPGDEILTLNGQRMEDVIDYRIGQTPTGIDGPQGPWLRSAETTPQR